MLLARATALLVHVDRVVRRTILFQSGLSVIKWIHTATAHFPTPWHFKALDSLLELLWTFCATNVFFLLCFSFFREQRSIFSWKNSWLAEGFHLGRFKLSNFSLKYCDADRLTSLRKENYIFNNITSIETIVLSSSTETCTLRQPIFA